MTRSDVFTRLRDANPFDLRSLDGAVPSRERNRVRDTILATPRGRTGARERRRALPARRLGLAGIGVVLVAALVVTFGAISRPDHVGGPTTATAAEVLRAAGAQARATSDYSLTGTQRVYSGYLGRFGSWTSDASEPSGYRFVPSVYSGEWWTAADGAYLIRTRAYSAAAVEQLGIEIGESDYFSQSAHPTDGSDQPMTYEELRAIPVDPDGLRRYVDGRATGAPDRLPSSVPTDARVAVITDLLVQPLAPAALRGSLYDLLATQPGVVNLGSGTDAFGRIGALIGFPSGTADTSTRSTLLLDPVSAAPLESRVANYTPELVLAQYGTTVAPDAPELFSVRTYVGPVQVEAERVVPDGVSVNPRP